MTQNKDKVCDAKNASEMKNEDNGLYDGGLSDHMVFDDGICGGVAPYYCNVDAMDKQKWHCADKNGGNGATCTGVSVGNVDDPWTICNTGFEKNNIVTSVRELYRSVQLRCIVFEGGLVRM
jgi:hypothetical protein